MAAPAALVFYNEFKKYIADGTFDLDGNTIKAFLLTSSYTPNVNTDDVKADIDANEVANGNGYTTGGVTIVATWVRSSGTVTFDAGDASWTGASSGFVARYLALYASGTLNGKTDPLIGYIVLDSAPADVSFAAGNIVTVVWHANGIFTLS